MTNKLNERVTAWLLGRPAAVALLLLALVAGTGAALPSLRFASGIGTLFDKRDRLHQVVDQVNEAFVTDELLFIVYEAEDVFAAASLRAIRRLGQQLEQISIPNGTDAPLHPVDDVTSLATVDDLVGTADAFRTTALVPTPVPSDPAALRQIRQRARRNPLVSDGLLGPSDDRVAVVLVRLVPDLGDERKAMTVAAVRQRLDRTREDRAITQLLVCGPAVMEVDSAILESEDITTFVPAVYAVTLLLLIPYLRRVLGLVVALVCVSLSLMATLGALVLAGGTLDAVSVILPPVITALAMATCIHYLSEIGHSARQGGSAAEVGRRALSRLLPPVFLAALTTAVGFASLSLSPIPAVRGFGIASAAGMLATFVICLFVFALVLRFIAPRRLVSSRGIAASPWLSALLLRLSRWIVRRRRGILAAGALLLVIAAVGVTRLRFDMNEFDFFREEMPVRRAAAVVDEKLGGSTVVVVSVRARHPGAFLEPAVLKRLVALGRYMRQLGLSRVTSVADYLALMHRELYGGAVERHRIPDTAQQTAQLLLINGDTTVNEYLDHEQQWARVVARSRLHNASELQQLFDRLESYLATHFPAAVFETHATGQSRLWAAMVRSLARSQALSLSLSFTLIFGLMFVVFRSFKAGLFSMPPNLFPIFFVLGLMGWIGIWLDAATIMIATVALGIAVDDTVHFMQHYLSRVREHGDAARAVEQTLQAKGPAIIGTSLIIAAGFAVLLLSNFPPSVSFGLLVAATMLAALIGDLVLLPALLVTTWGSPPDETSATGAPR